MLSALYVTEQEAACSALRLTGQVAVLVKHYVHVTLEGRGTVIRNAGEPHCNRIDLPPEK